MASGAVDVIESRGGMARALRGMACSRVASSTATRMA